MCNTKTCHFLNVSGTQIYIRKNRNECYLVRREGEKIFWVGLGIFHLGPQKICLFEMMKMCIIDE